MARAWRARFGARHHSLWDWILCVRCSVVECHISLFQLTGLFKVSIVYTLLAASEVYFLFRTQHYCHIIMGTMASQITSLTIVYSTVHSGTDQRRHQSSAWLASVWGIHRDRDSNAKNVSIWWRHHVGISCKVEVFLHMLCNAIFYSCRE